MNYVVTIHSRIIRGNIFIPCINDSCLSLYIFLLDFRARFQTFPHISSQIFPFASGMKYQMPTLWNGGTTTNSHTISGCPWNQRAFSPGSGHERTWFFSRPLAVLDFLACNAWLLTANLWLKYGAKNRNDEMFFLQGGDHTPKKNELSLPNQPQESRALNSDTKC